MAKKRDGGSSPRRPKGRAKPARPAARKGVKRARRKPPAREARPGLAELIGQALTDAEFRERLFTDRPAAVRPFRLTRVDQAALDRLTREQIEEQASRLGGRAAITIKVVISKSF